MTDADPTDAGARSADPAATSGQPRRLSAVAGAALLAGTLAATATGLAGLAAWSLSTAGAEDRPARTGLVELADASGRLATTVALFVRSDRTERDAARARLDQDAARLAALLSSLPEDGDDDGAASAMRRLLAGIDTELADLRRIVERRDEEQQELEGMVAEIRDRHAAFRQSLGTPAGGDGDAVARAADTRLRLDDLASGLAAHLYTALTTGDRTVLDDRRRAVAQLAHRLRGELEALPVGASAVRQIDAARRLTALGIDAGNVFEQRLEIAELDNAAVTAARNARDRAETMGTLARTGRDGDHPGAAGVAPPLLAAALTSGMAAALGVAAAVHATPRPLSPTRAGPAATESARATAPEMAGGLPRLHVLVAEDEQLNQMVAAALLRRNGHTVTTVGDGLDAVAVVEREPVDLVLMDLRMPNLDGIGALRRIRGMPDPARARTRIVVLTASAIPEDADAAQMAGADAVLPKPLRWEAMEPVLRRLFTEVPPHPAAKPAAPSATHPGDVAEFDEGAVRQMRGMLPAARVAALIGTTHAALTEHHRALMAAWASGDRKGVSALAHRIAGVSGVYGCTGLRAAAQALELAIEREDGDPGPLVRRVDAATAPALAHLRALLAETGEQG